MVPLPPKNNTLKVTFELIYIEDQRYQNQSGGKLILPDRAFTKAHMFQISQCLYEVFDFPEIPLFEEGMKQEVSKAVRASTMGAYLIALVISSELVL